MSPLYTVFSVIVCWIILRHDYQQPSEWLMNWAVPSCLLVGALSRVPYAVYPVSKRVTLFCISCLAVLAFLSEGWIEVALLTCIVPLAVHLLCGSNRRLLSAAHGSLFAAALVAVLGFLQPLLSRMAHLHLPVPPVAALSRAYFNLLYESAAVSGSKLTIGAGNLQYEYVTNWEILALESVALLVTAAVILGLIGRRKPGYFALVGLVSVVFVPLRFVWLVQLAIYFESPAILGNTWGQVVSVLPLVVILARLERIGAVATDFAIREVGVRQHLVGATAGAMFGVCLSLAVGFHDPGGRAPKRILIDEAHSEWSWTDLELDRTQFGTLSVYNFRSFFDLLTYYYDVSRNEDTITPERLAGQDLLVVKMPTRRYSEDEISAITDFVRRGGGLWVIGDHTNVFGTSLYSNEVLAPFDIRLAYDSTYELDQLRHSRYRPPTLFAHPIVRHLDDLEFQSSCSVSAPWNGSIPISGYGMKAVGLDYGVPNFFSPTEYVEAHPHRFGRIGQAASVCYGKGRVSVFTDSTMFSSFCMFWEGRPELTLGYVEWTGRTNRWAVVNRVAAMLAVVVCIGIVVWISRHRSFGPYVVTVVSAVVGTGLTAYACDALTAASYRLPEPGRAVPELSIDLEHSEVFRYAMLAKPQIKTQVSKRGLTSFLVCTQRAGLVPRLRRDLATALRESPMVALFQPGREFTRTAIDQVEGFVRNGGKLLLAIDTYRGDPTPAIGLLKQFGIGIKLRSKNEKFTIENPNGEALGEVTDPIRITGADPMFQIGSETDRDTIIAKKQHGAGLVIVLGSIRAFSDEELGFHKALPDEEQLRRINLLFGILDELRGVKSEGIVTEEKE